MTAWAAAGDCAERAHPADRLRYAMRRCGPKGCGVFERISLEAALAEICVRLREIRDTHGCRAILPYGELVPEVSLGRALTGELGLDPPVRALIVCNADPLVSAPEQHKVIVGLAREDLFTVVSDRFLTDTARYADILLPVLQAEG